MPKLERKFTVETTERRIRGSNEVAYLTANYETTFSSGCSAKKRMPDNG